MEDGIPGWLQHCHKCYRYSDTNNFYFILFYFLLFFLILLFFLFYFPGKMMKQAHDKEVT